MSTVNSKTKFCPKCQAETERNKKGECKVCVRIYAAAWRSANQERCRANAAAWDKANPERKKATDAAYRAAYRASKLDKLKARGAAYRAANPGKLKAFSAAYRAANQDKAKAYSAAYRLANQEKEKARLAAYRAANPEKVKAKNAAWNAANPEASRIYCQNRRARKRENGGSISKDIAARLFKLQKGKCACCKQPLGDDYQLDHIMPLALGGSNTDDNMQLLRQRCNHQKHAKHPIDFMQERGFLI